MTRDGSRDISMHIFWSLLLIKPSVTIRVFRIRELKWTSGPLTPTLTEYLRGGRMNLRPREARDVINCCLLESTHEITSAAIACTRPAGGWAFQHSIMEGELRKPHAFMTHGQLMGPGTRAKGVIVFDGVSLRKCIHPEMSSR